MLSKYFINSSKLISSSSSIFKSTKLTFDTGTLTEVPNILFSREGNILVIDLEAQVEWGIILFKILRWVLFFK